MRFLKASFKLVHCQICLIHQPHKLGEQTNSQGAEKQTLPVSEKTHGKVCVHVQMGKKLWMIVPQLWWIKIAVVYSLQFQKLKVQNECWKGCFFLEGLMKITFQISLLASTECGQSLVFLGFQMDHFSLSACL